MKKSAAALNKAREIGENVKAMFAAIQTGQAIVATPQSAMLADQIARSAGFVDKDVSPIFPEGAVQAAPAQIAAPGDTTPLTPADPASPAVGLNAGMTDAPTQPPQ